MRNLPLNFCALMSGLFAVTAFAQTPAPFTMDSARTLIDPADAPPPPTVNGLGDWAKCLVSGKNYQPVATDTNGQILPGCLPDTLYSWGPDLKLQDFNQVAPAHAGHWADSFTKPVYATLDPAATWAYADGGYGIRMKLKAGTHFILYNDTGAIQQSDYCSQIIQPPLTNQNTVIMRYWLNGDPTNQYITATDYILCSPGPVHSWSVNMPRHYDELAASLIWNQSINGSNKWISYAVYDENNYPLFDGITLDNHDWSSAAAISLFQKFHDAAVAKPTKGYISFAPGVAENNADHFSSAFKAYWHWAN